jgi:outer membrane protein assembly factor BamD
MKCWLARVLIVFACLTLLPRETPAPLIYRPGEGWTYEPVEGERWTRTRAEDQLEVAKNAFEEGNYRVAVKASRRVVRAWPLSDFAPEAQYILARSYEARGLDERAFQEYQKVLEKYPQSENYEEILERQFAIANRYLDGQWFKLWGVIPFFPSMDKTSDMFEKVIKNGPHSEIAPQAQMNIGVAREKQSEFPKAVQAYETAADRYHDNEKVAADALYKAGIAYHKQAQTAEYDQSVAGRAIGTFTDFAILYPNDPRVPEAQQIISSLRSEQARGSFDIARFYEKRKRWEGALVYYNEVLVKDPNSPYAAQARQRIEALQIRLGRTPQRTAQN